MIYLVLVITCDWKLDGCGFLTGCFVMVAYNVCLQENIVGELQKKADEQGQREITVLEELKRSLEEEQKQTARFETELNAAKESLEKVNGELRESRGNEERLSMELAESKRKEEEEHNIR